MDPNEKPNVLISVPNTGWIHQTVVRSVFRAMVDPRITGMFATPQRSPAEANMNAIARQVLDGGFDYWLNIDDDNAPVSNPVDLVFLDLDIVGAVTPVWQDNEDGDTPYFYNAHDEVDGGFLPHKPTDGLQRVDAVGAGCVVIARRVLEKVKAPFAAAFNEDGTIQTSADFQFCRRARAAGFKVWGHFDYRCLHVKEMELSRTIELIQNVETSKR